LLDTPEENTREQELEFPKKLHLVYQDQALGYTPTKQTALRSSPDIRVFGEASVEVPVVLDKDEAAQVAEKLMKTAWVDTGGEVKFSLPDNKCYLTPTDCVNLTIRGRTNRVRIERVDSADGVINIQSRHDRQSSYESTATGVQAPDPLDPVSNIPGVTYFEFINSPALIDNHDLLGYYVAVRGEMSAWRGCLLEISSDGGATFRSVRNITQASVMGTLLDPVAAASEYSTDTTNQIRLQILGRDNIDLPSVSYEQMLQENNAIIVGDEIMQYQDAVEESSGVWVLTTLLRGRLQTAPVEHLAGERFVLLNTAYFIPENSSLRGTTLTHRATSFGNDVEDSTQYSNVWSPTYSQVEFTPMLLSLERDLSDVITANWSPRYRFGTSIVPIQSVNDRGFRISISDGVDTVVLADQAADNFVYDASALGPSVTVSVSHVNRITGTSPYVSGVI